MCKRMQTRLIVRPALVAALARAHRVLSAWQAWPNAGSRRLRGRTEAGDSLSLDEVRQMQAHEDRRADPAMRHAAGGIHGMGRCDSLQWPRWNSYARDLGLAFQIADDLSGL